MPVLALATTEAARAVPPEAGCISTDVEELLRCAELLVNDPEEARRRGKAAREAALERYGLDRFLADWDECWLTWPRRELGEAAAGVCGGAASEEGSFRGPDRSPAPARERNTH